MTQLGELQEHLAAFHDRHAAVVAVCNDPVSRNEAVTKRLGLAFPVLADPALAVIRAFGVEDPENGIAWPAVFVIDATGRVRFRSTSPDVANRPTSPQLLKVLDEFAAR